MKIAFLDFWKACRVENGNILPGFNPERNFFTYALKAVYENVEVVADPFDADVIVYSCFGKDHLNFPKGSGVKKIFFTGENIRPDFNECDWAFTFDFETYGGRNIRLPLWFYNIDWFGVSTYDNPAWLIPTDYFSGKNPYPDRPKTKAYCIAYNNPVKIRLDMIEKLRRLGRSVEIWGKHTGNWFYREDQKMRIYSDYRFCICFENTIYPGYNTEKLIHAKTAGCVPLYWGSQKVDVDFNSRSYLNMADFPSMDAFVERVIEIENDPAKLASIQSESLFNTLPSLEPMLLDIKRVFGS
jgi:alpha(1,3/1,4) fucosyltransferase